MAVGGGGDLVGRVLADRYRLLSPIGAGGSGRVYIADDVKLKRRVAVKVLHPGLAEDAGFLRRFRNEARLSAQLHHPNIMAVHDWGDEGEPFMVVELLTGGSLRGMLDAGATLTPSQAAHVGAQVASALEYAHGHGFVHRDIKPANLLFDEHGIVRVADFGLARALAEASWTEPSGTILGTARYASPEQVSGSPLDQRSDLYALALVLVEAVTGDLPFATDTTLATLAARTQSPVAAPAALGPLVAVVERAGRVDPNDRYPDAATMRSALEDAVKMLPPPGPLRLAGLDEVLSDPNPTQVPVSRGLLFDQERPEQPPPVTARRPAPPRRRPTAAIVVGAAISAAVLTAAVLLSNANLGAAVVTPNAVGSTLSNARDLIASGGLLVTENERFSDDPRGVVIAQSPAAGHDITSGGRVQIVVSRGPAPIAIPRVAGKTVADARSELAAAGFAVIEDHRFDETAPSGTVIRTKPAQRAPRDSTVAIVVSDGKAPVAIPDLANGTYDNAVNALTNAGFIPARSEAFSDTVAAGTVINTDPAGGGKAQPGSTVKIIVSKGPDVVTVPNVRGLTLDAASAQLQAAGLTSAVSGAYRPGAKVRAQDPPNGGVVKRGATVTLFF